ncbi:Hypothetical predicted protein [Pelobates cultripes]|uniref:Uncharacterized protein n=1 Tax=Pelobates cultripes TaxID=61616 RepID=A0AAD1WD95_PELCU|nr:Hypothetical predicted protein [Pelobates cultripes]
MAPSQRIGTTVYNQTHKMVDPPTCHSQAKRLHTQCRPVSQGGLEAKLDAILSAFWAKLTAKAASPQWDPPAKDQRQAAQKGRGSRSGIQRCPVPATSGNHLLGPGATKRTARRQQPGKQSMPPTTTSHHLGRSSLMKGRPPQWRSSIRRGTATCKLTQRKVQRMTKIGPPATTLPHWPPHELKALRDCLADYLRFPMSGVG